MKRILMVVLAVLPLAATAAKKPIPLPEAAGAAMSGKTVVVTRHEKPSFVAFTPGKAMFAMIGAAAMISAGNKIVRENEVTDPTDIIESELVPAVARHYGFTVKPGPAPVIAANKPKDILAAQADGDYVLDLQSTGWQLAYYPVPVGRYWTSYAVRVQLVERATGKVLSDASCLANNHKHATPPTYDALLADKAQLLKDAQASHGWSCVQVLGKDQFHLADGETPAIPATYVDPLAAYAATHKD